MEKEKTNSGLIVLIIILIICVLGLCGYIAYDKGLLNTKTKENTQLITTQKQETNEKYDIEGILLSFDDLGLNLKESFKKDFKVFINNKKSILTIENKYEVTYKDENITFSKNSLNFYLDNALIVTNDFTCDTMCQRKVNKIAIYNKKYLALNFERTTGSNGWLSDIDELHLYDKNDDVKTIKSVSYVGTTSSSGFEKNEEYNTDIYIDGEYIYYYADENNTTERTENMKIYKYRTTIDDKVEKLDYMFNFNATTGEIK